MTCHLHKTQECVPKRKFRDALSACGRDEDFSLHAYFDVDLDIVWQVVSDDLPKLLYWINQAINVLEESQ